MRTTKVYTDGSFKPNFSGIGVFYGLEDERNASLRLPRCKSALEAEMHAIVYALKMAERYFTQGRLIIYSDCRPAIQRVNGEQFHYNKNSNIFKLEKSGTDLISGLKKRGCRVTIEWVPGHRGIQGNVEADHLASLGAKSSQYDTT